MNGKPAVMNVRCPNCDARYELGENPRISGEVKVRCPRCRGVFTVPARSPGAGDVPPDGPPEPAPAPSRPRRLVKDPELAQRLARAMVSEILLNAPRGNGEAGGETALRRFGPAIASAYALYQERVSPDLSASTKIFREAVNDILGRGRRLL